MDDHAHIYDKDESDEARNEADMSESMIMIEVVALDRKSVV